jgi:hypothetical protein
MRSGEARRAATLVEPFTLPWSVNYLHVVQLENLLARAQLEGNQAQKRTGSSIAALWRARMAEGVIAIENPPWDDAWRAAIGFHREVIAPVPQPSSLLHLAAAGLAHATHYLSLDGATRQLARRLGFDVLPEIL